MLRRLPTASSPRRTARRSRKALGVLSAGRRTHTSDESVRFLRDTKQQTGKTRVVVSETLPIPTVGVDTNRLRATVLSASA